jgi:hypothetical protein
MVSNELLTELKVLTCDICKYISLSIKSDDNTIFIFCNVCKDITHYNNIGWIYYTLFSIKRIGDSEEYLLNNIERLKEILINY